MTWRNIAAGSSRLSRLLGVVLVSGALVTGGVAVAPAAHSEVSCVDTAATESTAAVLAKACARRVESLAARTETGQVFANPDGSWTAELTVTPRRVRRADGSWVPVDPTLRRNADGTWSAVAATAGIRFSGGGGAPLVALNKGARSFTMTWLGALPAPVVAGDTATYPEVRPGVDLVMRATVDGFTHVLVVKNAKAAVDPAVRRIGYRLGGSRVRFTPAAVDGVEVTGDDGAPVLRSGGAATWDSTAGVGEAGASTARAAGAGARVGPASSRLDGDRLLVEPDPAMLATARYPLYVDPVWITPGLTRWAYATNNNATNETTYARVGLSPEDGRIYRSFFEFPTSSGGRSLAGTRILSATFSIELYHTYSCAASPVYLWRTSPITGTPRTGWSPVLQRYIDTKSAAADKEPTPCYNPDTPTLYFGNNLTNDVQVAADAGWSTYTLGLAAAAPEGGESTQSRWKKFFPGTASLTVNYNNVPSTPSAASMSIDPSYPCGMTPVRVNALNGLTLRANLSDPDGDNVRAQWQVTGIPAQYAPPDSGFAAGGPFTTTIPAAAFTDGLSYSWSVRADDGTHASAYSPGCPFIVDNTVPSTPTATSTQLALTTGLIAPAPPATAVVGLPATVDLTPAAGDHNIAGYLIGVGAAAALQPAVWVPAAPDGSAHAAVVPVASGITANILTIKARNLTGQVGATATLRFKANAAPATVRVRGDATGDGRADITMLSDIGGGNGALWRWDATPTSGLANPTAPQDVTTTYPLGSTRTVHGDFDGDGRSDTAVFAQSGANVTLSVQRSDSNQLLGTPVLQTMGGWTISRMKTVDGDFNGDGLADIAVAYDMGNVNWNTYVLLSTSTPAAVSFAAPAAWYQYPAGYSDPSHVKFLAGDFNGDGRSDIAQFYDYGSAQTKLWVHWSQANNTFTGPVLQWDSGPNAWFWGDSKFVAGDFTGDGKTDLAAIYAPNHTFNGTIAIATFAARSDGSGVNGPGVQWTSGANAWDWNLVTPFAGDFDGDGKVDLATVYGCCGPYQYSVHTFTSTGPSLNVPVLRWQGGLGTFTTGSVTIDTSARYQLVSPWSGKCLMVPGGTDGAQLVQHSCDTATNATFTIERIGGGFVRLRWVHAPASCLDLRGVSQSWGAAIEQWTCNGNTAQLFLLNYVSGFTDPVFTVGVYASGLVLDITGYNPADGVPIQQWGLNGGANQLFTLRRVS